MPAEAPPRHQPQATRPLPPYTLLAGWDAGEGLVR